MRETTGSMPVNCTGRPKSKLRVPDEGNEVLDSIGNDCDAAGDEVEDV